LRVDSLPSTFFNVQSFLDATNSIHDLDEQNIYDLQVSIEHWINQTELKNKNIVVWVSPFARTLETASYLVKWFQEHDLQPKHISVVENIKEVEWFSWAIFDALVRWWTVIMWEKTISLDVNITNPQNLSHTDYFFDGYYKKIDAEYLQEIGISNTIWSMETYVDVTARSKKVLGRVLNAIDNQTVLCIVTHQAFSDWITKESCDQYEWQKPWEIFYLTDSKLDNETIKRIT
jgi:broad specificity phosphatase PhoE